MVNWITPLARTVLSALERTPRSAEELAHATFLPVAVVEVALLELRSAGRAEEAEPGRWRAR